MGCVVELRAKKEEVSAQCVERQASPRAGKGLRADPWRPGLPLVSATDSWASWC